MATTTPGTSSLTTLEVGALIPAGARTVDTRPIEARLAAGGHAQLICSTAQRKVRAAEEHLSAARARLGDLDVEQDEQALAQLDTLQAAVREARQARDALMRTWAAAVAAFKRRARAAAGDGAPAA